MAKRPLCVLMLLLLGALIGPTAAHCNPKEVDIEVIPCNGNGGQGHPIPTYVLKGACIQLPVGHQGNATCKILVASYVGGGYGGKDCPRFLDSVCRTRADFGDYFVCQGPPTPC